MTLKQARTRASHQKSPRGCVTCKIRRVKCDENLPECQRCVSTGRRCEGPKPTAYVFVQDNHQSAKRKSLSPSPSIPSAPDQLTPWLTTYNERRAFSFYLSKAAPNLSGSLDLKVWASLLPQVAQTNTAVRYAILAVSGLLESPVRVVGKPPINPESYTPYQACALKWYGRALGAQRSASFSLAEANCPFNHLVTLLLFACIEIQQGNFSTGIDLFYTGFIIVAPLLAKSEAQNQHDIGKAPMDYFGLILSLFMRNLCLLCTSSIDVPLQGSIEAFQTLDEACIGMFRLLCAVFGLIKETYISTANLTKSLHCDDHNAFLAARRIRLKHLLSAWRSRMDTYLSKDLSTTAQEAAFCLLEYHQVASVWLEVGTSSTQVANPERRLEALFFEIIDGAKQIVQQPSKQHDHQHTPQQQQQEQHLPAFFFDMAILAPLYLTVIYSSHTTSQNQAFELMRNFTNQKQRGQLHAMIVSDSRGQSKQGNKMLKMQMFRILYDVNGAPTANECVHQEDDL